MPGESRFFPLIMNLEVLPQVLVIPGSSPNHSAHSGRTAEVTVVSLYAK